MKLFYTRPDRYLHLGVFPEARTVALRIGGAPAFMHGLRALFISDVHLRPGVSDERLDALTAQIAAEKADLLLLGGDYAETPQDCLRFFDALKGLSFPLGAYAVPGNNDAASRDTLAQTAERAGVTLLKNTTTVIDLPEGRLCIGGCDDHKYGTPLTAGLFSGSEAYRVLLSHFPVMPDCECDLVLCGHTHGGQCNLLGITPYSVGFERRFRLLGVRGLRKTDCGRMFIGNGIGISRVPLRLGAQPQIYLLEFGSEDLI